MAHIHEKIDFTASVYVVLEDKVLLHFHKKRQSWMPPGGHVELDEDPNQAAIREVYEESGQRVELIGGVPIKISDERGESELVPPRFMNRHHFNEAHEHVDLVYFARATTAIIRPEEAGGEIQWFTAEEIEGMSGEKLWPRIRAYALSALKELGEKT